MLAASAGASALTSPSTPVLTWVTPAPINYGAVLSGKQLNAACSLAGTLAYSPAAGTILTAGQHTLSVTFTPADTSQYTTATANVMLTVNRKTPVVYWPTPLGMKYGAGLGASQLNASSAVTGTFTYSPPAGTVLTVGSHTLSVEFTPADAIDYTTATASVTLTVNQKSPVINWHTPLEMTFGAGLGAAQLNAASAVPGTYVYSPAAGTVLNAGTHTLSVTFTPADTTDYTTASASVALTIKPRTPIINWRTPPPIIYGTALGAAQLRAATVVPGSLAYSPGSGTVLRAGTQTLLVTFTPDDTANYTAATGSVTLTVNRATPPITWALPPVPFVYPTPLSSQQLDATSPVPGKWAYSPGTGTIPSVGQVTLSATFAPTDTVDYTAATASVTLSVYATRPAGPTGYIQHVIVIMQENRSFDNLFNGFPGADTAQSGLSAGETVQLLPVPLEQGNDVDHTHLGWWKDWDGGAQDGFGHTVKWLPAEPYPNFAYAYVPQSETAPLWALARGYTLADRMFQSNTGPSFVAHQYMIAGQSDNVDEDPGPKPGSEWGCDSPSGTTATLIGPNGTDLPGEFPCFDYRTLVDLLDEAGISWRYYAPAAGKSGYVWSAFDAINHVRYGSDWTNNVISPNSRVLSDIENGTLAQMTWIVPDGAYSDHAGPYATNEGPDWVANIVNAVGASSFWNSTAILISWDDWGGWYDHVHPPQVDAMGLGFRVPLLVVSPWSQHGYVSHQQHEFGSFLHFTETVFNLPSLGTRDAISDDLADCFDFTQTPQPYVSVPVQHGPSVFTLAKPSLEPPDDD